MIQTPVLIEVSQGIPTQLLMATFNNYFYEEL